MNIRFAMAVICTLVPFMARAQAPEEAPPKQLVLTPAAESVPAMKYRLLPDLGEQTAGNAIALYFRAYSPEWQSYRHDKNWREPFDKALEASLKDLPRKDIEWVRESKLLRELDRAARRTNCDWELKDRIKEEGVTLMLPDLQGLREFARLLAVRARLELAEGNFDKAAYSLRTSYALARHTGDGPTLIHGLVAVAIGLVTTAQVEAWVQIPNSPNLYWALTDLPKPFIDFRKPLQGERITLDNILPDLRECLADPTRPAKSPGELRNMLKKIAELTDAPERGTELSALLIAAKYPDAKTFLAQRGWTSEQIDAVTATQAVLMQEAFEYDRYFDGYAKAANLPFPQSQVVMKKVMVDLGNTREQTLARPILAGLLLPAVEGVFSGGARLDRQIAVLRVVEAIRMHAVANGNQLPASLDAIKIVPVPLDPALNAPFNYSVSGDKAMLSAEKIRGTPIRYELTIRK